MEKKLYLVTKFVVDIDSQTPGDMTVEDLIDCYRDSSTTVHDNIDLAYDKLFNSTGYCLYTVIVNGG